MTPGHRRTIQNALLADQELVRERLAMLGVSVISEAPSVEDLWRTPLAQNLVIIAEFVETGGRLEDVGAALQMAYRHFFLNLLNEKEYILPKSLRTLKLGRLFLEAQLRLVMTLLRDQERPQSEETLDGRNQAIEYTIDVLQNGQASIDITGVGSCLPPFAQLVLAIHVGKVKRILLKDSRLLFFGTSQLWLELFLFVATRRQIQVVDATRSRVFDLRKPTHEAAFRLIGRSMLE